MVNCDGPLWDYDDLTPCAKQRYFQVLPLVSCGLISLLIVLRSVRKSVKKQAIKNDPARQPLLQQQENQEFEDQADHEYVTKPASYGAVIDGIKDLNQTTDFENTPGHDKKSPVILATIVRPTSERLRVTMEWVLATLQLALSIAAFFMIGINAEWNSTPLVRWVTLLFWFYLFALVSVRVAYIRSEETPLGGLWYHSTALYPISLVLDAFLFRSALLHPFSSPSKLYYTCRFFLTLGLCVLNLTAKFGNKPAKLYVTERHPNPEPVSSIFHLLTFSWVDPYIWKGYWESTEAHQVWELREDDHAFFVLRRFRKLKKRYALGWCIIRAFIPQLFIGGCYAVIFAFSMFAPAFFIKMILDYVENREATPKNVAWIYVVGMLLIGMCKSITNGQALHIGRRVALRLRAILIGEIYAKALRRKASAAAGRLGQKDSEGNEKKKDEKDDEKSDEKKDSTQANLGAIINLMSVDAFKVAEVAPGLHYFVSGILQIFLALFFLYFVLGWSSLIGFGAMLCFVPINYWFATTYAKFQDDLMAVTDQRVEKVNELLQCIRIIKFFAWEDKFADGVNEWREKELKVLKARAIFWACGCIVFFGCPVVVTTVCFAAYTMLQGETLTSPVAFTAMTLFNIMRGPIDQLAFLLMLVLQGKVSFGRISEFLSEDETEKYNQLAHPQRGPNSPYIGFENASFSWRGASNSTDLSQSDSSEATLTNTAQQFNFKLKDLNVDFPVGKLTVIAGPTGSGKTSMLMALLGEMDLDSGNVYLPGACSREDVRPDKNTGLCETVAYCSQQAWLLNDTLRNNILFASDYDEDRYNRVIEACALKRDLEILDAGDQTEVGEKGVTLSGGQKQRISLARAVYSNSKHIILDDCLSAVDSHTALYIYNNCIRGDILSGRTIILVSHNVALTISQADKVVVVDNGRVKAQGTPAEVVATGALGSDDLVKASASESQTPVRVDSSTDIKGQDDSTNLAKKIGKKLASEGKKKQEVEAPPGETAPARSEPPQKLVQEETMARGTVDKKVYLTYLSVLGNKWFWITLVCIYFFDMWARVLQSWWVRQWTVIGLANAATVVTTSAKTVGDQLNIAWTSFITHKPAAAHSITYYLSVYFGIGLFGMVASTIKELSVFLGGIRASRIVFDRLLHNIIRAKSRFFDSTPVGRIMNRFSKDIEAIDQELPAQSVDFGSCLLLVMMTLSLIVYITPAFLFAAIVIAIIYYGVATFYLGSSRELKRLDSVTRSPIFQHFGETLVGISTIRAYGEQRRFIRDNMNMVDINHGPYFYLWCANRWLYFRVDTVGAIVCSAAAAFIIRSDDLDSGWAGMSLSFAFTFNEVVLWAVRLAAELELAMNSVERVNEYTDIESEAPPVIEESRPPVSWPSKGEIEFDNVNLRYAEGLPLVIKNASFKVEPYNKIGIVGRTGAGKSTIITAMFRLIEASSGTIKIDGLDIASIGLKDLRQALAIIPQDPTLFAGTIRSNLDPFGYYTDEQVFEALRRVHLLSDSEAGGSSSTSVTSDSTENANQFSNLDSPVTESGNNLSQGQRQLICLARSLLKNPRVLLLDEATASIDYDTDAKIQKTIRDEFDQTTLLTIAHRLRSIVDYDKILVMDAGEIVEYDEPYTLITKENGTFRDMCLKSGEMEALEQIATDAYKNKHANV